MGTPPRPPRSTSTRSKSAIPPTCAWRFSTAGALSSTRRISGERGENCKRSSSACLIALPMCRPSWSDTHRSTAMVSGVFPCSFRCRRASVRAHRMPADLLNAVRVRPERTGVQQVCLLLQLFNAVRRRCRRIVPARVWSWATLLARGTERAAGAHPQRLSIDADGVRGAIGCAPSRHIRRRSSSASGPTLPADIGPPHDLHISSTHSERPSPTLRKPHPTTRVAMRWWTG